MVAWTGPGSLLRLGLMMRGSRAGGAFAVVMLLAGCPGDDADPSSDSAAMDDSTGNPAVTSGPDDDSGSASDSPGPAAWLQVGWGIDDFNEFSGTLPVEFGAQGLFMFSLVPRGQGFHVPPDPGFGNPDMPIIQAWVDVEGYSETPAGHFNEVSDYPALFYPGIGADALLEGSAIWLTLPDGVDPIDIHGLDALVHVELLDRDGVMLVDEHALVIDAPPPPG